MAEQIEVEAVPIGDGTWMAAEDPASGAVYYANQVTGATQWEWPTTVSSKRKAKPGANQTRLYSGPEPEGGFIMPAATPSDQGQQPWIYSVDESSGATYYINTETQVRNQ